MNTAVLCGVITSASTLILLKPLGKVSALTYLMAGRLNVLPGVAWSPVVTAA